MHLKVLFSGVVYSQRCRVHCHHTVIKALCSFVVYYRHNNSFVDFPYHGIKDTTFDLMLMHGSCYPQGQEYYRALPLQLFLAAVSFHQPVIVYLLTVPPTHTTVPRPNGLPLIRLHFIGQNKEITLTTCSCLHIFKFQAGLSC